MGLLDEKNLEPTTPADTCADGNSQQQAVHHSSNAFSSRINMWHDSSQHAGYSHSRPMIHASMPMIDTGRSHYVESDNPQEAAYGQQASWPGSAMSGTSTPTPVFDHSAQDLNQVPYQTGQLNFNQLSYPTDPFSATAMSPQSSQGGWMSTASSDGAEPRTRPVQSPDYRTASPSSHVRGDGIRKKNARFDIPAERNLANIDSLILQTADEHEKKELKQQKRLLRNRQAA